MNLPALLAVSWFVQDAEKPFQAIEAGVRVVVRFGLLVPTVTVKLSVYLNFLVVVGDVQREGLVAAGETGTGCAERVEKEVVGLAGRAAHIDQLGVGVAVRVGRGFPLWGL